MEETVHRAHLTPWEGPLWEVSVQQATPSAENGDDDAGWWEADPEVEPVLTQETDVPSTDPAEVACRAATALLQAKGWHLWGDWSEEPGEYVIHVGRTARSFADDDPSAGPADIPAPPIPVDRPGYGEGSEHAERWKRLDALADERRRREADVDGDV